MELSPFEHFRVLKEGHDENVNIFFPFLSRLFQRKCISPSLSPRGILPRAARELTFPQSQPGAVRTRSERGPNAANPHQPIVATSLDPAGTSWERFSATRLVVDKSRVGSRFWILATQSRLPSVVEREVACGQPGAVRLPV